MPRAIRDSDHQPPVVTTARSDAATAPGTMTTTVVRALARALTGAVYIAGGYAVVRAPGGRVGKAADTLAKIRRVVPLPIDDELIVRVNGGAQLVAGATLALGIKPRFSAAVLAHRCYRRRSLGMRSGRLTTPWNGECNRCNF
jgi:hypothetical protein